MVNIMLLTDVDTLAGNSFESLDRVVSSKSEEDNTGITAGDADIYGLDRSDSTVSWADAQVLHNNNTDRDLTLQLVDSLFQNVWTAGGSPKVLLTG